MFGLRLRKRSLSAEEKKELLQLARSAIESRLYGVSMNAKNCAIRGRHASSGAFVTLKKQFELRGCVGLPLGGKPLMQKVLEAAEAAAFKDPRFPPLSENELKETTIEISVLSSFRRIFRIDKIDLKRHGLFVRTGKTQGLLLPQVARANAWSRQVFLEQTCLKAGLSKDAWKNSDTEIMIFEAEVFREKGHDERK